MVSFIIAGDNKKERDNEIELLCNIYEINKFDKKVVDKTVDTKTSSLIGIEDVRKLNEKLYLKSYGKTKAAIIEAPNSITIEAQNALLKVLEEPPPDTIVILSIPSETLLLPTILSRCKVIKTKNEDTLNKNEKNELLTEFQNILTSGVGKRLKKAEELAKNKDEALLWLKQATRILREELLKIVIEDKEEKTVYYKSLNALIKTYTVIATSNTNLRFTLENLFLSLPVVKFES